MVRAVAQQNGSGACQAVQVQRHVGRVVAVQRLTVGFQGGRVHASRYFQAHAMLYLQHAASSLHPDAQVLCQGCSLLQVLRAAGALLEVEQHAVSQRPRAMALARLHGVGAPAQLLFANLLQVGQGK